MNTRNGQIICDYMTPIQCAYWITWLGTKGRKNKTMCEFEVKNSITINATQNLWKVLQCVKGVHQKCFHRLALDIFSGKYVKNKISGSSTHSLPLVLSKTTKMLGKSTLISVIYTTLHMSTLYLLNMFKTKIMEMVSTNVIIPHHYLRSSVSLDPHVDLQHSGWFIRDFAILLLYKWKLSLDWF